MLGTLRTGIFLALLEMAAGELQALGEVDCDSSLQGCDVDERSDEAQGLDLLQMQIRLQSDPAQTVTVTAQADAHLGVVKQMQSDPSQTVPAAAEADAPRSDPAQTAHVAAQADLLQSDPAQTVPAVAQVDAQLGVVKSPVFAKVAGDPVQTLPAPVQADAPLGVMKSRVFASDPAQTVPAAAQLLQRDPAETVPAVAQVDAQLGVVKSPVFANVAGSKSPVHYSGPAQTLPAAVQADAPLGVVKSRVFAKVAGHRTDVHTLASRHEVESAGSQYLNAGAHLLAVLKSGITPVTYGLGSAVFIGILCVGVVIFRRSQRCSQEVGQKPSEAFSRCSQDAFQKPSWQESPPAQKLLPTALRSNSRPPPFGSPVSSIASAALSPLASPANSGLGLPILTPICPSLISPHSARCTIPIDSFMTPAGKLRTQIEQFDILGTSGRKLLHATVSETPEGRRCLALASCGCDDDPHVKLAAPRHSQRTDMPRVPCRLSGIMELYGKKGKFYGTLEPAAKAGALLRCDGELVMSMEIKSSGLRMSAATVDGRVIAFAGQNSAQTGSLRHTESKDMWTLQVEPNFDAVLIAACMLGALIFR